MNTGSRALPGFFLSGFLFALLGAMLPAWGYHLHPLYATPARYFLFAGAGVITGGFFLRQAFSRFRSTTVSVISCALASFALLALSFVDPLASEFPRLAGWAVIGLGGGLLNASLFEAMLPDFQNDPARTINRAGIFFGLGCLASALLVAGTFYLYSIRVVLLISASVPLLFGTIYHVRYPGATYVLGKGPTAHIFRDFLNPRGILFALLLFFQTGNEWTVAGWLPIYLIRRLGISPVNALWMLAFFWSSLLIGRVIASNLLTSVRHRRLLLSSAASALFGCVLLTSTGNILGAAVGTFFCGSGFAIIYPLVVEGIGRRFPYYHPGVVNSVFSLALAGGMLAPWSAGFLADRFGLGAVMGLPLLGTLMVVFLLLLMWLESKVTGR